LSTSTRRCGALGSSPATVAHGRSEEDAERWVAGSDDRNADLVEATRTEAGLVLRVVP
jgi:hypothetical protein